jgi:pimeloyl-ACP methyl ester carboxylesterase
VEPRRLPGPSGRDRSLQWRIIRRGFWTNGAADLSAFIAEMFKWKLDDETVGRITCPTLVTAAESDFVSSNAKDLYDALACPKQFVQFRDADGAGMHCEMLNRSLANRTILDWLDETLTGCPEDLLCSASRERGWVREPNSARLRAQPS